MVEVRGARRQNLSDRPPPASPRPAGPTTIFLSFCSKLRPLLATPLASIPMIYHKRLAEIIETRNFA